ncbi:MAG TPA: TonB-dependent receptor [Vicinamibacterales bacterium]|nr:TonB-dependent receptor [Vicinamibacterales bacterium]
MHRLCLLFFWATVLVAVPASAATITGLVTDSTGAALTNARVTLRSIATGEETVVETDGEGRYRFDLSISGSYLVIVARRGFAEAARTVLVEPATTTLDIPISLELGVLNTEVSVTASRGEREVRQIPLHVETLSRAGVEQSNALSTGDVLAQAVNVTPVGNGPFGVRPRLRGLDSTRMLVLVDGERLNTARQATDRTGAEVGLISTDTIDRIEIINGAGTLMYGSDALAGTVNIITNEPTFSPGWRPVYGFNGFYSSNENGMRGTMTLGGTSPRATFRIQAGAEKYDNYRAGNFDVEDTRPLFASGTLRQADTIDSNFPGFNFRAFPDPFNAPFVRTDGEILNSQAEGKFVNASGLFKVGERRTVRVRYQNRRMENIGFPDFEQPYFFNDTSLPHSNLDKISARYEAQAVTPWLANLSLTAYYQRLERLLRTTLPLQFPAPTPVTFFPISVLRLDVLSDTEQRVWTPGVDLNAVFVPAAKHLLTTGLTFYRDRSSDQRTTSTTTSLVGQVAMGARGPAAVVFPSPVVLGPASLAHPVRVPDASLRNIGIFAQDEWRVRPSMSVIAGLRGDFYNVTTEPTPGYDVQSLIANARPPIDPSKLPDPDGATYTRKALTGDIGVVSNPGGAISPFIRFGRSYRHPNLEEMLFAGPATTGSLVPNVTVEPEAGNNLDAGLKFRAGRLSGGAYYFLNHYKNFIAQDLVVATTASGALAQSRNFGNVRVTGVELSAAMPLTLRPGVLTLTGGGAFTRGTITDGTNPLDNRSLAGTPFDNVTPSKVIANARFTQSRGLWWVEYGVRVQGEVTRVAETLLDSPFLIAQDLLSLDGFAVQRLGWGVNVARGRERVAVTFAVENLADRFYREHFQFAPARGRSFTVGLTVGAF